MVVLSVIANRPRINVHALSHITTTGKRATATLRLLPSDIPVQRFGSHDVLPVALILVSRIVVCGFVILGGLDVRPRKLSRTRRPRTDPEYTLSAQRLLVGL
jgi:hypothetical protein